MSTTHTLSCTLTHTLQHAHTLLDTPSRLLCYAVLTPPPHGICSFCSCLAIKLRRKKEGNLKYPSEAELCKLENVPGIGEDFLNEHLMRKIRHIKVSLMSEDRKILCWCQWSFLLLWSLNSGKRRPCCLTERSVPFSGSWSWSLQRLYEGVQNNPKSRSHLLTFTFYLLTNLQQTVVVLELQQRLLEPSCISEIWKRGVWWATAGL